MRLICVFSFFIFSAVSVSAQDMKYARTVVDTLASPYMEGRGYVNDGLGKAASYIAGQFFDFKLKKYTEDYTQKFGVSINTFPGAMEVKFGSQTLEPGVDYLIGSYSHSIKGTFPVAYMDKETFTKKRKYKRFLREKPELSFVILNLLEFSEKEKTAFNREIFSNRDFAAGLVLLNDKKLTWGAQDFYTNIPIIELNKQKVGKIPDNITVDIENEYADNFICRNVIGYVEGTEKKDSIIVFTAHYDHLGRMGAATYFPGANDNASGSAMLLTLAKYYAQNKPKYTTIFIAFAGEEIGLLGSKYFVENPLFDLKKIKQLINLDMVGTGDEGITVVNTPKNLPLFNTMQKINTEKNYLPKIVSRNNTQNSDHFPFSEKGVPAVFIYTMGGIKAYHDIYDRAQTLPLTKFEGLFKLLTESVK